MARRQNLEVKRNLKLSKIKTRMSSINALLNIISVYSYKSNQLKYTKKLHTHTKLSDELLEL